MGIPRIGNWHFPNRELPLPESGFVRGGPEVTASRVLQSELAPVVGQGDIVCKDITITNVAHVEGLNHNLFRIGKFCDKDLEVNFKKRRYVVRTEWGRELLVGTRKTNLYTIKLRHLLTNKSTCLISKTSLHQSLL
ncbi:hypothetical protein OSB04_un000345 [Centaurea solstitialis]|uniref:Uncharacterized protein n=1 Tax=Centaurea solstitialis TaxID=347529 RepID=A0AA38SCW8_9ASTR|nr:hypothetical protein OSB04_un000345 [Centaurea solstitialis]